MKANELMVGDLVLVADGQQMNVRKVASITRKKIGYHKEDGETRMWHAPLYSVNTIPLTEGMIVRNWDKHVRFSRYGFPNIIIDYKNYMLGDFNYVHEFQHSLRLCGLTDLADNFKVSPN